MTNAHTPGPWVVSFAQSCETTVRAIDPRTGQRIATTFASHANQANAETRLKRIRENEANARLIAAAPDLLEALRGCLPYIRNMDDEGPDGDGWQSERLSRLIAEVDAAIAKATATEQGERG